jgi:Rrf2 family transcriptional regulator, nitric oxide-sensitive transcriptional repressor
MGKAKMLPKTTEYALRAAVWLGRTPRQAASADQLAEAIQVPRRYLHKVLQDLVRAGLVRSQPGPGGGYALQGQPEEITILDVINAVGSIARIDACPLGLKSHTTLCPLHHELDQAYANMEAAFSRVTVAQLLNTPDRHAPLCESVP